MPELPEVEVVRRGLQRWVTGRPIADVDIVDIRCLRRHLPGSRHFVETLQGRTLAAARRRGKYLWLPLDSERPGDDVLVAHLGMSGQLLVQPDSMPDEAHLRARIGFDDGGRELRFVDQRTFGGLAIDVLVDDGAGGAVPSTVAHIARDPLDELFDLDRTVARMRSRSSGVKRVLLDQGVVSGIGNIYADETLWLTRLHYDYPADSLTRSRARELIAASRAVMERALEQGGTSFDSLYVNVNGESGYFSRLLEAYGREGEPCARCGAAIVREPFMNRSSYRCPRCQRRPRSGRR